MLWERYKITGIAQADTIQPKWNLCTFVERRQRKKDSLSHFDEDLTSITDLQERGGFERTTNTYKSWFVYVRVFIKRVRNSMYEQTHSICSNPRYSWVTYFILSNFYNFSQFVVSTHPLLVYQFCHLINLSSSYQTSVIFSPFVIYSLFTLSTHPINAPTVHITNTSLSLLSYRAHALCANIPF